MYLIALCDDEADAIQKTEDMLGNYQREHKWLDFAIERFENADMLLNKAKEENYMPDLILICTYKYDQDILDSLSKYEQCGVKFEKLHRVSEMPWVF